MICRGIKRVSIFFSIILSLSPQPMYAALEWVSFTVGAIALGGAYVGQNYLSRFFVDTPSPAPVLPPPVTAPVTTNNITIHSSGSGAVTIATPTITPATLPPAPVAPVVQPEKGIGDMLEHIKQITFKHYGTTTAAVVAAGYLYLLYSISKLQKYLTSPTRINQWLAQYEFNKLLLLEPRALHELIVQEFMDVYHVTDQKSLKDGIHLFMDDLELELELLERYQTLTQKIEKISHITQKCGATCGLLIKSLVPFSGLALQYAPAMGIQNLFFIDIMLKNSTQERISRLHYYKNVFLQSPIVL